MEVLWDAVQCVVVMGEMGGVYYVIPSYMTSGKTVRVVYHILTFSRNFIFTGEPGRKIRNTTFI
jgi:hypothetical protein